MFFFVAGGREGKTFSIEQCDPLDIKRETIRKQVEAKRHEMNIKRTENEIKRKIYERNKKINDVWNKMTKKDIINEIRNDCDIRHFNFRMLLQMPDLIKKGSGDCKPKDKKAFLDYFCQDEDNMKSFSYFPILVYVFFRDIGAMNDNILAFIFFHYGLLRIIRSCNPNYPIREFIRTRCFNINAPFIVQMLCAQWDPKLEGDYEKIHSIIPDSRY